VTGDLALLRPELKPNHVLPAGEQALHARAAGRGARSLPAPSRPPRRRQPEAAPNEATLRRVLEFVIGEGRSRRTCRCSRRSSRSPAATCARRLGRSRRSRPRRTSASRSSARHVGLLARCGSTRPGVPYVILEKNAELGGTWYENTYPAAASTWPTTSTATPSRRRRTGRSASRRSACCSTTSRLRGRVRRAARIAPERGALGAFDEARSVWKLRVRTPEARRRSRPTRLSSAVGQLNQPKLRPPGMERFRGPAFHSARGPRRPARGQRGWRYRHRRERAQFVPDRRRGGRAHGLQRTELDVPVADYHTTAAGLAWLFRTCRTTRHLPFWPFWTTATGACCRRRGARAGRPERASPRATRAARARDAPS